MTTEKWKFDIFFLVTDTRNQSEVPRKLLETAAKSCGKKFSKPVMRPMFDVQYNEFRTKVARKFKLMDHSHGVMIFANDRYKLMSELMLILRKECPVIFLAQIAKPLPWLSHLDDESLINPKRDYIFFNIHMEGKQAGYLILEIFTEINPKISKSFMEYFSNKSISVGHYHVFKEGWFEFGIGGMVMPLRRNNHGKLMSHNRRGVLSFCEESTLDCDAFFIHFVPYTYFDQYRTVLGRVVHGDAVLKRIESLETEFGRIGDQNFSIHSCGVVPIGRNQVENADEEEFAECISQLFDTPFVQNKDNNNSEAICLIPKTFEGKSEGELASEPSGYSTPATVIPRDDNYYTKYLALEFDRDQLPHDINEESTIAVIETYSKLSVYSSELSLIGAMALPGSLQEHKCQNVDESDDCSSNAPKNCPSQTGSN